MLNDIIKSSGLKMKETRFPKPPAGTYGVYNDEVEPDGGDSVNLILRHFVTVELYEPKPDPEAERAFEAQLNARGIKWHKQPRYWIQEEQRYQVIYDFSYIEKM